MKIEIIIIYFFFFKKKFTFYFIIFIFNFLFFSIIQERLIKKAINHSIGTREFDNFPISLKNLDIDSLDSLSRMVEGFFFSHFIHVCFFFSIHSCFFFQFSF